MNTVPNLLDSNIVSEIIKREPDFNVIKKIAEHNSTQIAADWFENN